MWIRLTSSIFVVVAAVSAISACAAISPMLPGSRMCSRLALTKGIAATIGSAGGGKTGAGGRGGAVETVTEDTCGGGAGAVIGILNDCILTSSAITIDPGTVLGITSVHTSPKGNQG